MHSLVNLSIDPLCIICTICRYINKQKAAAILHDPSTALSILQKLGFERNANKQQLVYKSITSIRSNRLFEIYQIHNISDKLFDLASNRLLLKKLRSSVTASVKSIDSVDKIPHLRGVFIYDPLNFG